MTINQAFTILQNAGGIRAARIITENTKKLTRFNVWRMARALRRGVPVAKIIHQKWFFGLKFYTNKFTLDPRPDTETLVAAVIADMNDDAPRRILDLGTGTACIISAICANVQNTTGIGIERSYMARRVARRNVKTLGLGGRIDIRRGNFCNARCAANGAFDVIVSNPPYIAVGDTRVDDGAKHDPRGALYADNNGLGAYMAIAKNARRWIRRGGKIYLEIGMGQDTAVSQIFMDNGWTPVRTEKDLGGVVRVLVFCYK